ncbi:ABC transporter ATP-binding protein [Thiocapsa sp. UBA6158]|uniref:ABC transporter ATP-binding protein n=1 Tax=Thiocapsa sp. UBA6158 TaxID=1947692 RepID=UPI0025FBC65D|nr:ABC transporter ATP-binding protein [Thiocapsa sp. UBA6158]
MPAIKVENLSKSYLVGHNAARTERYTALRDVIARNARDLARKTRDMIHGRPIIQGDEVEEFWALKDVSFEVQHGETLGIIGRNGAGKSTLLKILSRITEPTKGRITLNGRVASLLEVGTGFHPELSGRENIYLNGAILGMCRGEIQRKFDEIVSFAEVEKFLDTPVKRYSSGMYVRLAFAVAAHLEPEILVVDEVLAVGDAQFQKKCLGKMGDVAHEGRTVLFVSHNMAALLGLCSRAILLDKGCQVHDGPAEDTVRRYIEMGKTDLGEKTWTDLNKAPGTDKVKLHAVRFVSDGTVTSDVEINKELNIEIDFWARRNGDHISTSIHLLDSMGVVVLASANMHSANLTRDDWFGRPHELGLYRTTCVIPANFLNQGRYSINVIVLTDITNAEVFEKEVLTFTVHETGAMRKEYSGVWIGVVRPKLAWSTDLIQPGMVG